MLSIGRFSKMTRLSVKALRLYDEIGLLRPARVDPSTSYRYYEAGQANRAETVRILRSLDLPLEAIRAVLAAAPSDAQALLLRHRQLLSERLAAHQRMLVYIDQLIAKPETLMTYDIKLENVDAKRILAVKKHTNLRQIAGQIGAGFGAIMPSLAAAQVTPAGPPLVVYHSVIDSETAGDIEICVPVPDSHDASGDVYTRELEGGSMACAVHRGPYEQIAPLYHAITAWIGDQGHEIAGPPRETYLNDPQLVPPAELLTRVEFPVKCA